MSLRERLGSVEAAINARRPRERLLLLAALVVVLLLAWDVAVRAPLVKEWRNDQRRIGELRAEIEEFEASQRQLRAQLGEDGGPDLATRLRNQVAEVDAALAESTLRVISPQQMVTVLRDMLGDSEGLSLAALRNLGSEPAIAAPDAAEAAEGEAAPRVFRHRVELVVRGEYFAVLRYLERLEELDWRFQWDGLAIETVDYPRAEVRLELSTLSLAEDWIGV